MYYVNDSVYYDKNIVTITNIEDDSLTLKWVYNDELKIKIVNKKEVQPLPDYRKYITYSKELELLNDVGSSDELTEFMLNDSVQVLTEALESNQLNEHTVVDTVYDMIYKLERSFEYLEHCIFVEGYMAAISQIKDFDEETWKRMVLDVLQTTAKK